MISDEHALSDMIKIIQKDVVNEYVPIKTVLLIVIGGRNCVNTHPMSKNIMINDDGGIGKDFLVSTIMKTTDKEKWFVQKSPTPASITLTQRPDKNGVIINPITRDTVIYIEDATPKYTDDNSHFKLILDNDVVNYQVVDKMQTFSVNIPKAIVIVTCAESSSNKQFSRRLPQLSLDNSTEQNKAITKRKLDIETGKYIGITDDDALEVCKYIKSLKKFKVVVPESVSDIIKKEFLSDNYDKIFIRTLVNRIYDYVKFSTIIHQHNRTTDNRGRLIATIDDYNNIRDVVKLVYKVYPQSGNTSLSQFNKRQKNIISEIENNPKKQYTIDSLYHLNCSGDASKETIYRDMRKIVREVKHIKLFETPLKSTSNYYYCDKQINEKEVLFDI